MTAEHPPVALVTGANKGIGRQVAADLAHAGCRVYLASRDAGRGADAKAAIDAPGLDVRPLTLDVADDASIAAAAHAIEADSGRLDVLVNNAGIAGERLMPSAATREAMRAVYETNVFGPVAVTRAMLPLLRAGARRVIVNVSSGLGSLAAHGYPDFPYAAFGVLPYCSSKTALNAFTVLLAKELRGEGFRVNAVDPGFTATDLNGHTGPRTVEQAAAVIVHYATLGPSGPTGGYFSDGGMAPW